MTQSDVVLAVIRYLGRIALVLVCGVIYLTYVVVHSGDGTKTVDPAAVGAVAGIAGLAGTVLGGLIAMLVSTRSHPADEPVPVVGAGGDPVETVEVDERGAIDPVTALVVVFLVVVILLIVSGGDFRFDG